MYLTATAWLALSAGGGAFTVGLVMAARMLPNLLFGLTAGTLADRTDRTRMLVVVGIGAMPLALALAWTATSPTVGVWQLVVLVFLVASLSVFGVPARQALVSEAVARDIVPNALALNATADRAATAVGGLTAGVLITTVGVPGCFVAVALAYGAAASLVAFVRPAPSPATVRSSSSRAHPPFLRALIEAGRMAIDIPAVRTLVVTGTVCEVFAFSFGTAVPAFARDVLGAGAEGLGTLNAATSLGGATAVLGWSLVPGRVSRQPLLGLVFMLFGFAFLALAQTRDIAVAFAVLLVIGACAGSFDLLQQTLLQLAVPGEQRARSVGLWVFSIGSAPLGHLEMGSLIAGLGAPVGLTINACVVLAAAATLLVRVPGYGLSWRYRARDGARGSADVAGSPRS
jgi:MFS family permease